MQPGTDGEGGRCDGIGKSEDFPAYKVQSQAQLHQTPAGAAKLAIRQYFLMAYTAMTGDDKLYFQCFQLHKN